MSPGCCTVTRKSISVQVRARARDQGVERLLLLGLGLAQQALGVSLDAR